MTHEELIARLRQDDTDFWHCEAADRIEALVKARREDALELLAAHGQAQEAYEAQLKSEARADAAEAERDKHRRNWERAFNANTALEAQIEALTAQVERLTGAERAERDAAYAEGFADAEAEPLYALIQKGGDACDKDDDPTNARPATSPGVTAGAISKGAADDRTDPMQELIDAYEDIMDYGIVFAKKAQQDRLKAAKEALK